MVAQLVDHKDLMGEVPGSNPGPGPGRPRPHRDDVVRGSPQPLVWRGSRHHLQLFSLTFHLLGNGVQASGSNSIHCKEFTYVKKILLLILSMLVFIYTNEEIPEY